MEHLKPWFQIALPVVISINIFFLSFIALIAFAESSLTLEHQRIISVSINTITLGLMTSFLSILFGTFFAVLTTYYDFPLKKIISIALVLPIAFPLYVYAFIFVGGLEYSGGIATWIRSFDIEIGDSIAVDGICLTVKEISNNQFKVDVSEETLKKTTLGEKSCINDIVNLEPALRISDRLGGHIVTGHIDGLGKVENLEKLEKSWLLSIK